VARFLQLWLSAAKASSATAEVGHGQSPNAQDITASERHFDIYEERLRVAADAGDKAAARRLVDLLDHSLAQPPRVDISLSA
jgi:hypothetical protein